MCFSNAHLDFRERPLDAAAADTDVPEVECELLPLDGAHPRQEAVLHRAVLVLEGSSHVIFLIIQLTNRLRM